MTVITRFAPSPTGFLHIGGARTALFNYLFAKANGGQYRLRVEDTDKARSTQEATDAILQGLEWLGLPHDGEVVMQSQREQRHREVAEQLLASGHAYRCYCTPQELQKMRDEARAKGLPISYDRRWREREASAAPEGIEPVIRIKAPIDEPLVFDDAVQGTITVPPGHLDDFIILRSDATPTYMHAVVVDDHDMGITHIIRGDDHLNNASRQAVIYRAMGWNTPTFAHIPLIHGPDGAKLSKRHGALGVMEYAAMGYLPEALRNYLLRLGWSHGDDEIISDEQAGEWFNFDSINKAPARFDFAKLADVNGHYLRASDDTRICTLTQPELERLLHRAFNTDDVALLTKALPSLKERAKTLVQLAESALFYFRDANPPEDEKAHQQLAEGRELMAAFIPELEKQTDWNHEALFAFAKEWAEQSGSKIGKLMAPIRVAITGSTGAPSMFEVMEILGKDASLARLKAAC